MFSIKILWEKRLLFDFALLGFAFRLSLTCLYNIATNFDNLNCWSGAQTTDEKWSGKKVRCYWFSLADDHSFSPSLRLLVARVPLVLITKIAG